jgi:hypothetical protein
LGRKPLTRWGESRFTQNKTIYKKSTSNRAFFSL